MSNWWRTRDAGRRPRTGLAGIVILVHVDFPPFLVGADPTPSRLFSGTRSPPLTRGRPSSCSSSGAPGMVLVVRSSGWQTVGPFPEKLCRWTAARAEAPRAPRPGRDCRPIKTSRTHGLNPGVNRRRSSACGCVSFRTSTIMLTWSILGCTAVVSSALYGGAGWLLCQRANPDRHVGCFESRVPLGEGSLADGIPSRTTSDAPWGC